LVSLFVIRGNPKEETRFYFMEFLVEEEKRSFLGWYLAAHMQVLKLV
jgi:hypothetical protein